MIELKQKTEAFAATTRTRLRASVTMDFHWTLFICTDFVVANKLMSNTDFMGIISDARPTFQSHFGYLLSVVNCNSFSMLKTSS